MQFDPLVLASEVAFRTSRSGGKGGQHVNKVSTKVELIFNIAASLHLTDEQKLLLATRLAGKLSQDGSLHVVAQEERSQPGNKQAALRKFYRLIEKGLHVPKNRKPTKATRASKEKRLQGKKRVSELKRLRKGEI
jgi:ribosome-associated protein